MVAASHHPHFKGLKTPILKSAMLGEKNFMQTAELKTAMIIHSNLIQSSRYKLLNPNCFGLP